MGELENKTTPKLTSNTSFVNTKGKYKIGQMFNRPIVAGDLNLVEQDEIYAKMNPDNTVDNLVLLDGSSIISGGGTKPGEIELTLKYYNGDWIGLPIELEGEEGFHYVFDQLIEQIDNFNITDLNTGLSVDYIPEHGGYDDPNGVIEQFTTLHVYEIGIQEPITITVKGRLRDPETEFTIQRVNKQDEEPTLTYIPYLIPYDDIVVSPDFLNFNVIPADNDHIKTVRFSTQNSLFTSKGNEWEDRVSLFVGNGVLYKNEEYTDRNRIFTWQ